MNEELLSTHEELESSKEELQSLNEALTTVNARLQDKVDELEATTNDMTNLMASVDTAILFLAPDGTIQRFTPPATQLFNLIESDRGRPLSDITLRCDDPELSDDIDVVLKNLAPVTREVRCGDGQWYLRGITSYRTTDNRIDGVVLTYTDITPLKRAEQEIRDLAQSLEQRVVERSEELRQERNFKEVVLNTVPSLVVVLDARQRVITFNQACEAATGYNFDDMKGTGEWWKLVPAEEMELVRGAIDSLLSGRGFLAYEAHWLTRDGSQRLISWRNSVLRNAAGEVQCIVGSGLDITEQRRAENEARRHLEEASRLQRLQTAGELTTLVAHELNQPLAAIAMFADNGQQLLARAPLEQDKLSADLQQISEQAMRAGETLQRLRRFVSRGRIDLAPLDINTVVRQASALIESKARSSNISVHVDAGENPPAVLGDEVHIEQVLLNLMRNALDTIRDAGTPDGRIDIETRQDNHMVCVTIRDNGPGVAAAAVEQLFEPLTSNKAYGLGVGLRISRSLIEAQGGRLWVEPQTPGGVFHFVLPVAP